MEKILDIKYNIPSIKMFLSIFNLELQEYQDNEKYLNVYRNKIPVGKVTFEADIVKIHTFSAYGELESKVNYATSFAMTDLESLHTIGQMGLYATWNNEFEFCLNFFNGSTLSGNIQFSIKIDNEFGNTIVPHVKLEYKDYEKKYHLNFNESGHIFEFLEKRGAFQERIGYDLFNIFGGPYIYHSIIDKFTNGVEEYNYQENTFITQEIKDGTLRNKATKIKRFNRHYIHQDSIEFSILSKNDSTEEIVNKANVMNCIEPSIRKKILRLIQEFSIDGNSILENIFILSLNHYSKEEIYSLFQLDKPDYYLEEIYFKKENQKMLKKLL